MVVPPTTTEELDMNATATQNRPYSQANGHAAQRAFTNALETIDYYADPTFGPTDSGAIAIIGVRWNLAQTFTRKAQAQRQMAEGLRLVILSMELGERTVHAEHGITATDMQRHVATSTAMADAYSDAVIEALGVSSSAVAPVDRDALVEYLAAKVS